jgi:hypothetical protein
METRIRSMRKDARLSDQVTAGTGSRVAEGCLKQGHLHSQQSRIYRAAILGALFY